MRNLLCMILLTGLAASMPATETEISSKRSEALKLVHFTKELGMFRADIKSTIDGLRERKPELPSWFWEELEREVSTDAYAQWFVGQLERGLSEEELRLLNGVFSDEKKKALLDELLGRLRGKKGEEFVRTVQEFQKTHDLQSANDTIAFVQSSASIKYSAVLGEIGAERREVVIKLLMEADGRVRARHK